MNPFLLVLWWFAQTDVPVIARTDVTLVRVPVSVRDENGAFRTDLAAHDFEVFEDGIPQELRAVTRAADLPLTIAVAIDRSGSQTTFGRRHRQAAGEFLSAVLREGDRGMVVAFNARTRVLADLTGSRAELVSALDMGAREINQRAELTAPRRRSVGTGYHDAIHALARQRFQAVTGRKAILVFTDGNDNASRHSLVEAIEAAQSADVLVFHLGLSKLSWLNRLGEKAMTRISRETGGRYFAARRLDNIQAAYREMEEELRSLYELAYSPRRSPDGTVRRLEVRVKRPGWRVVHRPSYRAAETISNPK